MSVVTDPLETLDARYRALVDVAGVLASHVELEDLLHSLRGLIEPLIRFEFLAVYLRDPNDDTISLRLKETRNPVEKTPGSSRYSLADSYPGIASTTGRSVYVPRVQPDGPQPTEKLLVHNIMSFCAVPLTTPRQALGALAFGSHDAEAYTPIDVEFMERVAQLVAVAVENSLSLETVRKQQAALATERDHLSLLLDVTNAVVTELDPRALFRAVAPALKRCCAADAAALTLYDAEAGVLRKHACDLPGQAAHLSDVPVDLSMEGSPSGWVFQHGEARIFNAAELTTFPDAERFLVKGLRCFCSVPLVTAQGTLGTLNLGAFEPDAFSPSQFPLLKQIAGQIAIAVSNAMSYRRIEELNAQLAQEKIYLQDEIRTEQRSRRSSAGVPRCAAFCGSSRPSPRPIRLSSSSARPDRARSCSRAPSIN